MSDPSLSWPGSVTTVMFRNLPRRFDQDLFLEELARHVPRERITFVHVPMNLRSALNVGYAFVDFADGDVVSQLASEISGKRWTLVPSTRNVRMIPAYTQGFAENLRICAGKASQTTPLVFSRGVPVPFEAALGLVGVEPAAAAQPAVAPPPDRDAQAASKAAEAAEFLRGASCRPETLGRLPGSSASGGSAPSQGSRAAQVTSGAASAASARTTACGTVVAKVSVDSLFMATEWCAPSVAPSTSPGDSALWPDESEGSDGSRGSGSTSVLPGSAIEGSERSAGWLDDSDRAAAGDSGSGSGVSADSRRFPA